MTSIPDLVRASVLLYRVHARLFVGYASWLFLSYAAVVLATLVPNATAQGILGIVAQLADGVLWIWISVILTLIAAQILEKKEPDTNVLPWYALSVLGSFVWIGLLQALTLAGGLLLLVVPGLVFLVWFGFAPQALLLDGKKGLEAMTASRQLARGRFFQTAFYLLGAPIVLTGLFLLGLSAMYAVVSLATNTPLDAITGETLPLWIETLETIGNILLLPLLSIYGVLAYRELKATRITKE